MLAQLCIGPAERVASYTWRMTGLTDPIAAGPTIPGLHWPLLSTLASGKPLGAAELGRRTGLDAAGLRVQLATLGELGVAVEELAPACYRLGTPFECLAAERIIPLLRPATRRWLAVLEIHPVLDSTNAELRRRALLDARDGQACLAEWQVQGRGRQGRRWILPPGGGIALSLLKQHAAGLDAFSGLSLAAGVACARALERCGLADVGIKWPNDLLVAGRKLGGILVELGGAARGACHAVVGVGINVRLGAAGAAIDQPWTDLASLGAGCADDRNRVAAALIDALADALDAHLARGLAACMADFEARDALAGRRLRVGGQGGVRAGIGRGVDARGRLRVEFADGIACLDVAEVRVDTER